LSEWKLERSQIVSRYNDLLKDVENIILPPILSDQDPCYHLYPLRFVEGVERRRKTYEYLSTNNIMTQVHYIPIYWQPYYRNKYGYQKGMCPEAEKYYSQTLSLPLYIGLQDHQISQIVKLVKKSMLL